MLVLQSSTDPLHIQPGSSSESHATSSDGACNFSNTEVEEDVDVIEEGYAAINKEVDMGINQEEILEDITVSGIKSEPDKVSSMFVYMSIIRHMLPVSRNVVCVCVMSIFLSN